MVNLIMILRFKSKAVLLFFYLRFSECMLSFWPVPKIIYLEKQKLYKLGIFPQGTKSWLSAMCNSLNKQGIFLQGPNTKVHKNPV